MNYSTFKNHYPFLEKLCTEHRKKFDGKSFTQDVNKGMKAWIFSGGTGVGKTITMCKIMLDYRLRKEMRIIVCSTDRHSISSLKTLDWFAKTIGIECIALHQADYCVKQFLHQYDIIFFHTPAFVIRKPTDVIPIPAEIKNIPHRRIHVLPANISSSNLETNITVMNNSRFDGAIITKIDETVSCKNIFPLFKKSFVYFLGSGQNIVSDLIDINNPDNDMG